MIWSFCFSRLTIGWRGWTIGLEDWFFGWGVGTTCEATNYNCCDTCASGGGGGGGK